ncbi:MAG: zinc-binding dehydrogenase [Ilumatobacteraceae bacterium]|jgi:threonine dehydrogenase-like Zn-dependent dehydrogenase|nr:zinc-binding dehydrogenase [Ilumatobacteraceae bacterium]MDP4704999.1 zinc-binding dehydrogenase [Ilumatobacteraceae bacterium]MDP4712631.1 zinc-binding dehydrogenase [Ilumatobacteraceae bacterium]MDP4936246.1 zinc-binding dehydrogenase [Ilumatobacteraceae bacterium]MDP4976239.1 zinc-binding dehydrogenase [Ilumatobacteraceae bacterium]
MRAAVMRDWSLRVDDIPEPVMGGGQVLTKVLACGICGSDLHMLVHGEESRRLSAEMAEGQAPNPGSPIMFEPHRDTVMGHEFCCEVLDVGPGVNNLKQGDIVVSFPVTFDEQGVHGIGFSNKYPGGYSERIVINEMMSIKVPNGLSAELAAMTEPLAVGVHAVEKSRIAQGDAAIIIGLGPVGLACIAELKMRGIGPIIGADFSPRRRALAELLGADVVVDPREVPAIEAWRKIDGKKPLVIFEAVGVPGMIEQAMRMAPKDSRILIVGACMQEDHMHPMLGIGKELSLQFVLGYSPTEFGNALTAIAEGKVDLSPLITGRVGIDGVPQAFKDLGDPEQHAKILVMPK